MNLLVIGGAGYIGSHIVHDLVESGHNVTVFDNLSTGFKENLPLNCNFKKGDILNKNELVSTIDKNVDAVFHFAAKKAAGESMIKLKSFSEVNLVGTINILEAMVKSKVSSIIFSSTAAVYGDPDYLPIDESHKTNPTNFYGFTKLKIEEILDWYSKIHNINYASLRYFNAAGYDLRGRILKPEKNPQNLFPIIMEVVAGDRDYMYVYGNDYDTIDGTCIRDYIHVSDLSSAHISALKYISINSTNICVNLGTGIGYTVLESITAVEQYIGIKVNYKIIERRIGDSKSLFAKSSFAKELLDWEPKKSSLEIIVKSMWNLYKNKGK